MSTPSDLAAPPVGAAPARPGTGPDRRGSWVPTGPMISTRIMELRKRRGLMAALIVVTIGLPTVFLVVRLLVHAIAPKSYGPAGGYDIFTGLVTGVLYIFGFIVAAALGCTAGSIDLSEGMFRHLVVTGRSRLAIYLARIPAGLAIIWPLVAIGFTIVCAVCVFAAPTQVNYDGASLPAGLSSAGLQQWASTHVDEVLCDFDYAAPTPGNISCGPGPGASQGVVIKGPPGVTVPGVNTSPAAERAEAVRVARQDYPGYAKVFLYPSTSLMVQTGLWLELEAAVGLVVGLGLGSLLGQRTVAVILMIVLEVILTPIFSRTRIPHLINGQRGLVGLATAHLEPSALPAVFGGDMGGSPAANHGQSLLLPETRVVAVCVLVAWLVGWTAIGAWRMARRDA